MTAEHDGHEGREGRDEQGGDDGMDALLAVLADEPLSDEARADAAFMAAHRSAQADVALLREQLGIIGDALAEPPKAATAERPAPVRAARPGRPRRPRVLRLAVGAFAVAAVATVLSGMAWLLTQTGTGSDMKSGASDSGAKAGGAYGAESGLLECARLVVEGDVTAVQRVPGTELRSVTVRVTRHYKPAEGKAEITVRTDEAIDPAPRAGTHVLIGILSRSSAVADLWVTDRTELAAQRAELLRELGTQTQKSTPTSTPTAEDTCG
ncbi:hypothetical protein [Streptomyces sp. NPDC005209]|uniref:hypothetical protein n=1 Tax=Streptomyces sp. NPDC005209 TaxID=3156715 RepID=UPI0033B75BA3